MERKGLVRQVYEIIEEHYKKNRRRLVQKYKRFSGTEEDAEDIVQEAYARALLYINALDSPAFFEQWFSRILKNSLNNYLNEKRGAPSEILDEEELEGIDCPCYNIVLMKEVRKEITNYLPEESEVLHLYINHGHSPRSISRIVDMKYKKINNLIYRFKEDIKEKHGASLCS